MNAQSEKEKADREFELKKLQLELKSRVRESPSHTAVDGSGDHTASRVPNMKTMKLPPFHEKDN